MVPLPADAPELSVVLCPAHKVWGDAVRFTVGGALTVMDTLPEAVQLLEFVTVTV